MASNFGWKYIKECDEELYFVDDEHFIFATCQICEGAILKSIKMNEYFWQCDHGPNSL